MIGQAVREHPKIECVVMGKHGLVTWDDDPRACYAKTIRIIQEAEDFIAEHRGSRTAFGSDAHAAIERGAPPGDRGSNPARAARRGERGGPDGARFDDGAGVLDFVGAESASAVAAVGAACPDHLVHTKRMPLFVDWDAAPAMWRR